MITGGQIVCRWRDCNPGVASPDLLSGEEEEDDWRSQTLELLSAAHSIGGIIDLSFEVVQSRNAVSSAFLRDAYETQGPLPVIGPSIRDTRRRIQMEMGSILARSEGTLQRISHSNPSTVIR